MDTWACWWESPVERTTWSGLAERTVPAGGGWGSLALCISPVCHSAGSSLASFSPSTLQSPMSSHLACHQRQLESPLPCALSLSCTCFRFVCTDHQNECCFDQWPNISNELSKRLAQWDPHCPCYCSFFFKIYNNSLDIVYSKGKMDITLYGNFTKRFH